ncbi:hypothetical protein KIL84_009024 [Mauremys mutica]|uniref:Uncharacterized protein n=1 Tax=Mauremys mutica TaxID=74926 RepID=A0A9D3XIY4_9SAUR|nr:hypothetical protein KIL84_009024 [Mauremys mutica]
MQWQSSLPAVRLSGRMDSQAVSGRQSSLSFFAAGNHLDQALQDVAKQKGQRLTAEPLLNSPPGLFVHSGELGFQGFLLKPQLCCLETCALSQKPLEPPAKVPSGQGAQLLVDTCLSPFGERGRVESPPELGNGGT